MANTLHLHLGKHRFGTIKAYTIESWAEADQKWIFPKLAGGLAHLRDQLPGSVNPPIMIFDDITVYPKFKRKGLGSAGMLAALLHFRTNGSRVAFLRIGTQGEDWKRGKLWRQNMYQKLGWIVLDNHPCETGDVPIMWHPMVGYLSCSRVNEITLEIVDDNLFWS